MRKLKNLLQTCLIKKNVIHIRTLKQALKYGLVLKKVYRLINQKARLKLYIDMNTELGKKAKIDFELMNNVVFGKLWKM